MIEVEDGIRTVRIGEHEFAILQFAAMAAGLGLLATYLLPWIRIVGQAWPATPEGRAPTVETLSQAVSQGTVSAMEIPLLPELVAVIGFVTLLVSANRWNRWIHGVVFCFGITATGILLYMREGLQAKNTLVTVGDWEGLAKSFDPALGMWLALVLSALLIGIGFGAFLNTFEGDPAEGDPAEEHTSEADAPE